MARFKQARSWPTMDVIAAGFAAYRLNNSKYISSFTEVKEDEITKTLPTNRELVYKCLEDMSTVTDDDRNMAEELVKHYNGKTFKIISGAFISEFDRNAIKMLNEETCTEGYKLAVLASLPDSYFRSVLRERADSRMKFATGGYIGNIGERVTTEIEVLKAVFSHKWNIHYISGITTNDQPVWFGYKQNIDVGKKVKIAGTVKRQDNNQTQLSRVKVICSC